MGYDSRFYIVQSYRREHDSIGQWFKGKDKPMFFADKIAIYELGKDYEVSDAINRTRPFTDLYVYADDGNTEIVEDDCGAPLREMTIDWLLPILELAEAKEHYRRRSVLINLLKSFDKDEWGNLTVLHYGH